VSVKAVLIDHIRLPDFCNSIWWTFFNPQGMKPFDKVPDDDIPFHGFEQNPED